VLEGLISSNKETRIDKPVLGQAFNWIRKIISGNNQIL
jgi:hypothetical protein